MVEDGQSVPVAEAPQATADSPALEQITYKMKDLLNKTEP
jgi:hypothetical protein